MSEQSEQKEFDLGGLKCPMPIVQLNRIIRGLSSGDTCTVSADDPAFCPDVQAWCRQTHHELISCQSEDGRTTAVIRKCA